MNLFILWALVSLMEVQPILVEVHPLSDLTEEDFACIEKIVNQKEIYEH